MGGASLTVRHWGCASGIVFIIKRPSHLTLSHSIVVEVLGTAHDGNPLRACPRPSDHAVRRPGRRVRQWQGVTGQVEWAEI